MLRLKKKVSLENLLKVNKCLLVLIFIIGNKYIKNEIKTEIKNDN